MNLFRGLAEVEIDRWAQACKLSHYRAGERIVDGRITLPERVLLIRRGAVRLFLEDVPEHEVTADILGPGQLFGVSAVFGSARVGLHAEAVSDVALCSAEGLAFLESLGHLPQLALNLVQQVGAQVVQTEQRLYDRTAGSARVRLARVLLRLAQTAGEETSEGSVRLKGQLSRATLASQVRCSRETVARLLSAFEQEGRVVRESRQIVIPDLERLREVDEGSASSF